MISQVTNQIVEKLSEKFSNITDHTGKKVTIFKRYLPEEIPVISCPLIAIKRYDLKNRLLEPDQFISDVGRVLTILIKIVTFSQVSIDDCVTASDKILDEILNILENNPTIDGLIKGSSIEIDFEELTDERGVFFSTPTIRLTGEILT